IVRAQVLDLRPLVFPGPSPVRFRLPAPGHASSLARSVKPSSSGIAARLSDVRGRIADAAARSGRSEGRVRLIGVVKTVPLDRVREALVAGLGDLGQNRVQEAQLAFGGLDGAGVNWHMIGHLQRNKAARALEVFDRV